MFYIVNSNGYSPDGDTYDTMQMEGFSYDTWSLYSYKEVD